jgi:putative pyruvate formate lyase activating enzyme
MQAYPSYLALSRVDFKDRVKKAFGLLNPCFLCPRKCGINRLEDKKGFCKTGLQPRMYSYMPHFGEEPCISGRNGSGTIFFSNCNMNCLYCQNYEFSQLGKGREVGFEELADIMLKLQKEGCHNINLVTPTHIMPQILKALELAIAKGLRIPLVYNTSAYELPESLRLLEGIIDIYLADIRYGDNEAALMYSNAIDYVTYSHQSLKEMYRQVSNTQFDKEGLMLKGLIIRHLVLPSDIARTEKVMHFISEQLSPVVYISLMSQYSPYYEARQIKSICRHITTAEYKQAMRRCGLDKGWIQQFCGLERFAGTNIKPS